MTTITPTAPRTYSTATPATSAAPAKEPSFIRWANHHGATFSQPVSVVDAVLAAKLDFTVAKAELTATTPAGQVLTVPDKVATVRYDPDGTKTVLGVVGNKYAISQNVAAFGWAQGLVDDFDANIIAASSFGNPLGSRAYLALRTDAGFDIDGDPHDMYVTLHNSHDGSTGLNVSATAVRRDTGTEITVGLNHAAQNWSVRHSGDLDAKAREAADTMRRVRTWVREYEHMSYLLLGARMSDAEFASFAKRFLPTPKNASERSATKWAERRLQLQDLYRTSDHAAFGQGTRMAAFNAACAYVDERHATRGGDADRVRAARGIDGRAANAKRRAWALLTDF